MIHNIGKVDKTDEARAELLARHENFLRAGGVLSAAEWATLEKWERDVLTLAGDNVARERSAYIGQAITEGYEIVISPLDDGETLVRMCLREAIQIAQEEASIQTAQELENNG